MLLLQLLKKLLPGSQIFHTHQWEFYNQCCFLLLCSLKSTWQARQHWGVLGARKAQKWSQDLMSWLELPGVRVGLANRRVLGVVITMTESNLRFVPRPLATGKGIHPTHQIYTLIFRAQSQIWISALCSFNTYKSHKQTAICPAREIRCRYNMKRVTVSAPLALA